MWALCTTSGPGWYTEGLLGNPEWMWSLFTLDDHLDIHFELGWSFLLKKEMMAFFPTIALA